MDETPIDSPSGRRRVDGIAPLDAELWQALRRELEVLLPLGDEEREKALTALETENPRLVAELRAFLPFAEDSDDLFEAPVFDVHQEWDLGRRFGPYLTVDLLGRGGMGSVFLATAEGSEHPVALKLIRNGLADPEVVQRFQNERHILAALDHPGIARILDAGTADDGRPYFVMEAVQGEPIDSYCTQHDLSISQRVQLFRQVCAAVQWAHANLVVHCDLKPANILITAEGMPKLLDFGIAKVLRPVGQVDPATLAASRPLTMQYASPEQVRGEPITTACDTYALGALLYLLLSGRKPYNLHGASYATAIRTICEVEPVPPSAVMRTDNARPGRGLRGDLDSIVAQALAKEPGRRYASVEQLSEDLRRQQMDLPVRARSQTRLYRLGRFLKRQRLAVAAWAAILISAVSTTFLWFAAEAERDIAIVERQRADQGAEFLVQIFRQAGLASRQDPASTSAALQVEVMDRLAERAFVDPLVQAEILVSVGTAQLDLGQLERAEELLLRARRLLTTQQAVGGSGERSRRRLAKAANNLAGVYFRQGQEKRAEKMYRMALVGWTESTDHPGQFVAVDEDNAKTWSNLAVILMRNGALDEADDILQQVLTLRRQRLADAAPQAARNLSKSLSHLGALRLRQQRLEEAEIALGEALQVGEGHISQSETERIQATLAEVQEQRSTLPAKTEG